MRDEVFHSDVPEEPRPPRRKRARIASILAFVGVALVTAVIAFGRRGNDPRPSQQSDVPRREGDAIVVSEAFREQAGLKTAAATSATLVPVVRAVGAVEFNPTHVAAVGTRASGVVRKVLHVEGDVVEKGDVLAEIESAGLAEAQADLRIAMAKRHAAALNAERERFLLEKNLTTAREFEQARATLAEHDALVTAARERVDALGGGKSGDTSISLLRAPLAGVVAERAISAGQSVTPGLVAFRVGDVRQVWVVLRVFERHLGAIRVDDKVDVRPLSKETTPVTGKVAHVGSVLDPATRTADVRVVLNEDSPTLRPHQAVTATIHATGPSHVALSVPSSSVTYVDGAPTVFVAETPTRFAPRRVELGLEGGDRVEIVKGLREGEQVVSTNVLAIKSELFR